MLNPILIGSAARAGAGAKSRANSATALPTAANHVDRMLRCTVMFSSRFLPLFFVPLGQALPVWRKKILEGAPS